MRLSIPCSWDPRLLEEIKNLREVTDLYGAMPKGPLGASRPSFILPQVDEHGVVDMIQRIHDSGRTFTYVVNGVTYGNREWEPAFHQRMLDFFGWMEKAGVDYVVLAMPYLMELVREQFPKLKIKGSIINWVKHAAHAQWLEEIGVSEVCLDYSCYRDFPRLRDIKRSVTKLRLQIIVNICDLHSCINRPYHHCSMSFASMDEDDAHSNRHATTPWALINCGLRKASNPFEIIRGSFVRPEDLHYYEAAGVDSFKLGGRHFSTDWIARAARAYCERKYEGNLVELWDTAMMDLSNYERVEGTFEATAASDTTSPESLAFGTSDIKSHEMCNVDNTKLDGFIKRFLNKSCPGTCDGCDYCQQWADKAISYNEPLRTKYIDIMTSWKKTLTTSKFLRINRTGVPWPPRLREILQNMIHRAPENVRGILTSSVTHFAESNAAARNASMVGEEDLVRALLGAVPEVHKQNVYEGFKAQGIDPDKYLGESAGVL